MQTEINELEVNGIKYIKKGCESEPINKDGYVIIRSRSAGVFFGKLEEYSPETQTVKLKNSRRLWYWSGAASLSQLAIDGTKRPNDCKFPVAIPDHTILEVIEIIPCSIKAFKSINSVKIWTA